VRSAVSCKDGVSMAPKQVIEDGQPSRIVPFLSCIRGINLSISFESKSGNLARVGTIML
jgi:hypothetical protein